MQSAATGDDDGSTPDEPLLRWEDLREQGRSVPAEELGAGRPDLVTELRRRIEVLRGIGALVPSTHDPEATEGSGPPLGGATGPAWPHPGRSSRAPGPTPRGAWARSTSRGTPS